MKYCINCFAPLADDDDFCRKCGTKVEAFERISADESISLLNNIGNKYDEWVNLNNEIEQLEGELPLYQVPDKRPRYSAFRFFWPFLIYAQVAEVVVGIIFLIIAFSNGFADVELDTIRFFLYIFAFLAGGATLIIGGVYATKKRYAKNLVLVNAENDVVEKKRKIERRLGELMRRRNVLERELDQYNSCIPPAMRSSFHVKMLRASIENGEAKDLYEAVMLCHGKLNNLDQ